MILPWLLHKKAIKVAVVGDIILDEYLEGSVARISPEAPVPIHLVKSSHWSAGGAANTARNIQLAGGEASLFGVWGQDEAATILQKLLLRDGINIKGVLPLADRPTIKKTRITAGHQQMLRVDWEKAQAIAVNVQEQLLAAIEAGSFAGILISDYGKGGLPEALITRLFAYARRLGVPCVVDPKGKNFHKYRGCTLLTPNRKEACEALGLDPEDTILSGEELARNLQEVFGLHDVLVTMGAQGMSYLAAARPTKPLHKAPRAREVFDVSGAGDTVAALMTLGLAAGAQPEAAMELANLGAGIVVEKWGTQPIFRHELEEALLADTKHGDEGRFVSKSSVKLMHEDELAAYMGGAVSKGKKFVFTNGCFDILHAGHLTYLEQAKALGDFLIVAVNTDESIRRLKGKERPIVPLDQRMQLLAGLSCVDFVVAFGEETPLRLIENLLPQILVKGADYQVADIVGSDVVISFGGQVLTLPLVSGISTSEIVRRVRTSCNDL